MCRIVELMNDNDDMSIDVSDGGEDGDDGGDGD